MFSGVSRGIPSVGDLSWKTPVWLATVAVLPANTRTGNVLTASANGALPAIDTIAPSVGDRILVKNEATGPNNGIYTVTSLGSAGSPWVFTRASDADSAAECVQGATVFVRNGARNIWKTFIAGNAWTLNATNPNFASLDMVLTTSGVALNRPSTLGQRGGLRLESDSTAAFPPRLTVARSGDTDSVAILDDNGLALGPGSVTMDTRLRRSAVKTLQADDTVGGPLTLLDLLTAPVQGKVPIVTVFTAGGTWTPGANWQYAVIEVQGGGGAGGGCALTGVAPNGSIGGAGGAGGYARKLIRRTDVTGNATVIVGAGGAVGAAGAAGAAGNLSSFAMTGITTVVGNAGSGGAAGAASAGNSIVGGGGGGTATGGDVNVRGGAGGNGLTLTGIPVPTGATGMSVLGGAHRYPASLAGAAGGAIEVGGAGGEAAVNGASQAARAGGAGGDGLVIVTEFYGP